MAENENGEEKKYPAMPGHLRKLRDQGQYPHSKDFPQAIVLLMIVIYLLLDYKGISGRLRAMLNIDIFNPMASFTDNASQMVTGTFMMTVQTLGPIFLIVIVGLFITTMVEGGGILISFEKITPKFETLNPATGFQNMFKLNALVEALKGFLKATAILIILGLILRNQLNNMFWAPTCDFECVQGSAKHVFMLILIVGTVILLVFGSIDIPVSRLLFSHENQMTFTELKQELKDMFGDPHVRGARMALQREASQMERASFDRATLLIVGQNAAIALRFVRGTTPAPIVMAKVKDARAGEMQQQAAKRGMPIIRNDELVEAMMKKGGIAEPINSAFFDDVAKVLIEAGLFG